MIIEVFQAANKLDGRSYAIKKIKFETDESLAWFKVFAFDTNRLLVITQVRMSDVSADSRSQVPLQSLAPLHRPLLQRLAGIRALRDVTRATKFLSQTGASRSQPIAGDRVCQSVSCVQRKLICK